jgi:hypothetical protein
MSVDTNPLLLTFRNRPLTDRAVLDRSELFWSRHQKWLEGCGYMLRPRYLPGWVPSWQGNKKNWDECEDGQYNCVRWRLSLYM